MEVDRNSLRALVRESGRSARKVSIDAGLGATAIKDILSGKSRDPGASTLAAIAEELNVAVADLLEGAPSAGSSGLTHVKLALRYLEVRYRVQAGLWFEVDAEEPPEQVALAVLPDPRFAPFPQWLEKVVGDSANLRILPGQFAHVVDAVEMGYAPQNGHWVVVERRRDQGAVRERTIKQIETMPDGQVLLWPRSSNPKWREPVSPTDGARNADDTEVEIVGLVIGAYDQFTI